MASNDPVLPVGPWPLGIDNLSPETRLKTNDKGRTIALRAAVNVDMTNAGTPRTRPGFLKVFSGAGMHSGFASPDFPYLLAVNSSALIAYDRAFNPTVIRVGLKPMAALSYAEVNGKIFWSNGFDQGMLGSDLANHPFGLAGPSGTPTLTQTTGALNPGSYQVACTYLSNTGEESGSTLAAVAQVSTGGLIVSSIPQPSDSRVVAVRIYVSQTNGDKLYWLRDVPVGMTSFTFGNIVQLGKLLETQWLKVLPPGQIVRLVNGRIWVAAGNVLWYGSGFHHGLHLPSSDYIIHGFPITLLQPVGQGEQAGVYITSGHRTYYLQGGDPKTAQQLVAHPFGAFPGTGLTVPGSYFDAQLSGEVAFWIDSEGRPVLGLPGGQIRLLTRDSYVTPIADSGSSLIRDINGIRQIITNLRGTSTNVARATDSMVATISRNGVTV